MPNVKLTELVLSDAHQSLFASRMATADILPVCEKLDKAGFYALEIWGGGTFDSCLRFLNEDPWERLRKIKAALPNTKIMMLLRDQNLLVHRHYTDDIVVKFIEHAAKNGVDIFRIFDAGDNLHNLKTAIDAAKKTGKHVQAAISCAVAPLNTIENYLEFVKQLKDAGADSICIKDMAGLLKPYEGYNLVKAIKNTIDLPLEIHTHAVTGMPVGTLIKCAEAGADILDTAISSMSMGYSSTETMAEIFKDTEYDTGYDINLLLEIAAYFREIRKNYSKLESGLPAAISNDEQKIENETSHHDEIPAGFDKLEKKKKKLLGTDVVTPEDVLTYAMYPKIAPEFFKKRSEGPVVFKPSVLPVSTTPVAHGESARYTVNVNGTDYNVLVTPGVTPSEPTVQIVPPLEETTPEETTEVENAPVADTAPEETTEVENAPVADTAHEENGTENY
jgi:pyruvate/oxaloacetate carboxyltransferase